VDSTNVNTTFVFVRFNAAMHYALVRYNQRTNRGQFATLFRFRSTPTTSMLVALPFAEMSEHYETEIITCQRTSQERKGE
jgi:hypothetical protein